MMNCLEWLPIYFGILKAGAIAVPLNFRYTSQEIAYCLDKADVDILVFGPEFIGRWRTSPTSSARPPALLRGRHLPLLRRGLPPGHRQLLLCAPRYSLMTRTRPPSTTPPAPRASPRPFSSSTSSLLQSARMEAIHHATTHEDVFLCIPPLYHTGAKMHWFGSLFTGSRAVLLKGNSPRPSSMPSPKRVAPSCGSWCPGARTSWPPWTGVSCAWRTTTSPSGGSCTSAPSPSPPPSSSTG